MKTYFGQNIHSLHRIILVLSTLFLLSACGGGGTSSSQLDIGGGNLTIEFPASLNKHLTEDMLLKATLTIDGSTTIDLNVDRNKRALNGTVEDISKGKHLLLIEYSVIKDGNSVNIAQGTINITVGDRELISIIYNDFIYMDDDNDGITNIAELEFNTDFMDPNSKPESHGLHASDNYRIQDKIINRSVVAGTYTSANYKITQ